MLLGELDQVAAGLEVPLPPGRDHLDVGVERVIRELEAHLVVALARSAMGNGVGAGRFGDLDLPLGDQGPRDRGAEQIDALVKRVRPEHGEHEIAHELLAEILDEDLLDAEHLGLLARRRELLALAEIGGEGDDLASIGLLQPFQDDRGVEPAGISEHHLFDGGGHEVEPLGVTRPGKDNCAGTIGRRGGGARARGGRADRRLPVVKANRRS